jgi:hypothetical protein
MHIENLTQNKSAKQILAWSNIMLIVSSPNNKQCKVGS